MINTTILDQKYILFLSNRLKNFRDKGNNLFEFTHSCERPDSNRRRGYFYKKGNGYNFFCHNCSKSSKFFNFLREEDKWLYEQYHTELFVQDNQLNAFKTPEKKIEKIEEKTFEIEGLIPATESSIACKLIKERKIPEERHSELFFVEDFYKWASSFYEAFGELKTKEQRLIIPYIDKDEKIFGFTCRSFTRSKLKYIELKLDDREMIYGLNHINFSKRILCVEGPIDSMFLDNCVAVGGATYKGEFISKHKSNITIVPDNDWKRNKQVCNQILKLANEGYSIATFPDNMNFKDINAAIVEGYNSKELKEILINNTKTGPELILDITFRRKC